VFSGCGISSNKQSDKILDVISYKNTSDITQQSQSPLFIGEPILFLCILTLLFILFQRKKQAGKQLELVVKQRTEELKKQYSLMDTMNKAIALMLTPDFKNYLETLEHSMEKFCQHLDVDRMVLWQNYKKSDGDFYFKKVCRWLKNDNIKGLSIDGFSYMDTFPKLEGIFAKNKIINGPINSLSEKTREFLEIYQVCSLLVVPIYVDGDFWGIASLQDCQKQRVFSDNDILAMNSWSLLAVNFIKRSQQHNLTNEINNAAALLLEADPENYKSTMVYGVKAVCDCNNVARFSVWQNFRKDDGKLRYKLIYQWTMDNFPDIPEEIEFAYQDVLPSWEETLLSGKCINGPVSMLSEKEQRHLNQYNVLTMLVVPIFIRGEFWGFVNYDDLEYQRTFSKDEEYALRSWGLIVASIMQRGEIALDMRHAFEKLKATASNAPNTNLLPTWVTKYERP
jgi:GAF domain-containing protein